jgi:hypothetical protein
MQRRRRWWPPRSEPEGAECAQAGARRLHVLAHVQQSPDFCRVAAPRADVPATVLARGEAPRRRVALRIVVGGHELVCAQAREGLARAWAESTRQTIAAWREGRI